MVLQDTTGGVAAFPEGGAKYFKQFLTKKGSWVDHLKGKTYPFYGAAPKGSGWKDDIGGEKGSGPDRDQALMNDLPGTEKRGHGETVKQFQVALVCIDTGEVLGTVTWGFKIASRRGASRS